jgi:NDP-sugar pyrophosphorylase family protein
MAPIPEGAYMKAVILAAGKGTRMKDITKTIPKPMVIVNGKPMLEYIVNAVKNAGITSIGMVVGYKREMIHDHFGDGSRFGVSIKYINQDKQNGTGAALHLAREFVGSDSFFFTFGDVLTPQENYGGMIAYARKNKCSVLMGLNRVDDPYRGAAVYIDADNNIVRMVEKPPKGTSTTNLNNAGLMILSHEIFDYTARLRLSPRGEYELTDVFGMIRDDGKVLKGYVLSGYWKDVGTPEDLAIMNNMFDN